MKGTKMGFFDTFNYPSISGAPVRPDMFSVAQFLDLIDECRNEYACFEFRYSNGFWKKETYKISCEERALVVYWRVTPLRNGTANFWLLVSDTLDGWDWYHNKCGYQGYFRMTTFGDLYDNICDALEAYPDKNLEDFCFSRCSYNPEMSALGFKGFIDSESDVQLEWRDNYPIVVFCDSAPISDGFGSGW